MNTNSRAAQDVIKHYTVRHDVRGDTFGSQPFANYGYWAEPDLSIEKAAEALTDLVARTAGIGPGDRVLDVGCGYGANAVAYTRRYSPASVIGIDVTDVRIVTGRQYVQSCGLEKVIDLRIGDATALDFPDGSFSKIVAVECAFHFDTRRDFLREAARVLAPGGVLALTDMIPRRGTDPKKYMTGMKALYSEVCLEMPVNAYDADVYAHYLRDAGFSEARIDSIVEQTRVPFANALEAAGKRNGGERGENQCRSAERLRFFIEQGEDYVLVCARKPG